MTQPVFTSDWFSHNAEGWRRMFQHIGWGTDAPGTVVEVGSYEGRSTIWLCQNQLLHPDSRIYCVDTFEGSVEHREDQKSDLFSRFKRNIEAAKCHDKVDIRRGPSWQGLAGLVAEGVRADMVYIDGSHQAPDVLEDAVLAYRLLKTGGLLIFDDYLWTVEPPGREDVLNAPKLAIDIFANMYRRKLVFAAQSSAQIMYRRRD